MLVKSKFCPQFVEKIGKLKLRLSKQHNKMKIRKNGKVIKLEKNSRKFPESRESRKIFENPKILPLLY